MIENELLEELLAKPVGPQVTSRKPKVEDFTREVSISHNNAEIEVADLEEAVNEGTALRYLIEEGQNPDDWEVTHFRKIKYGDGQQSVRFSYKRKPVQPVSQIDFDELFRVFDNYDGTPDNRLHGEWGFLVLLGDMQFGKIDGDGPAGALQRTLDCLRQAELLFHLYSQLFDIGHIHVAWLGDHVEGFNSQGGANAWRTRLTLSEQIRLTRRVMLQALLTFAPLTEKVSMAAVPGNHGEAVRFEGTGVTRFDDSHDTESLIAVADFADLNAEEFGHVEFYVPDTDELIVMTEVAGTNVAHHHGHKWSPNKHFEWWADQSFNRESPMHVADLLVAGHLHHEHIEAEGDRLFIGVPSMESDSTWFRHRKGSGSSPGLIVALTKDGRTPIKHTVETQKEVGN